MRIAIFNQKGGVGKTTTTLNIAAAAARLGQQVLAVDLDPQAHLTSIHREDTISESRDSIFSHYRDNRPMSELLLEWPGIGSIIPAHAELIKVDSLFGKGPAILNKLNAGLHALERTHVHQLTVIDCCPFLGVLSLNALFAADGLVVPVASDFLSLRGAQQIDRTLKALEPVLKQRLARRYVLTRFDRRRKMSFEIHAMLREAFGDDVCSTVISENVAVAEAPSHHRDIFSYAGQSRGAQDYAELFDELTSSAFYQTPAGNA
ncbi:MAG: ParA family protein [Rhodocyclaceae bacterium]|nr:ParA family protein [Rhodocyclaceae bacterium]MBP7081833.1 ParA family protein [Rhodocyclaceae bacterium]